MLIFKKYWIKMSKILVFTLIHKFSVFVIEHFPFIQLQKNVNISFFKKKRNDPPIFEHFCKKHVFFYKLIHTFQKKNVGKFLFLFVWIFKQHITCSVTNFYCLFRNTHKKCNPPWILSSFVIPRQNFEEGMQMKPDSHRSKK